MRLCWANGASSSSALRFSIESDLKMRSPPLPLAKGPEHCTMLRSTRSASQVLCAGLWLLRASAFVLS